MLLQLFLDNTRPAMPKTSLDFVFFCDVNHNLKKLRFFAFSRLHFSEPLRKRKAVVCDLWLVDFDRFVCFCVSRFVALFFEKRCKFYLSSKFFF